MSSDSGVNGVVDKLVSVKEHIVDYSNDTAANVTIDNDNNGSYILGSDNSHHSMLSSLQQSTSISTSISSVDGSDIDLANLDDQRQLFNYIIDKLSELELNLEKEKNTNIKLTKSFDSLVSKRCVTQKKLRNLTRDYWDLENDVFNLDCRLIENEQYSRRENLIISGIPENVSQDALEPKVLQILETIGLSITSHEIAACHRLKKHKSSFPAHTIVRFTNRKAVEFCLTNRERLIRNKQKLKMNLRFYENLCESNETTIRYCGKLKQSGKIHNFFLRNGFVKIIEAEGEKPKKIHHPDDLFQQFEGV